MPNTPNRFTRRYFLKGSAAAVVATGLAPAILRAQNPGNTVNVACVGAGGKGDQDTSETSKVAQVDIVALCDVDSGTLNKAAGKYPNVKTFQDWREMLEKQKDIDAVIVSVPDHMHAQVAMAAIKAGKHVYVQKPLTATVWEARQLAEAARKHKVVTQMGNQGHSLDGYRDLCEYIWAGAIGTVREAYAWTNRPIWPQGMDRPEGEDPVPANLDWDAWLGPAPQRPFKVKYPEDHKFKGQAVYHPFTWRGWWDFGSGALGDMGCHILDGAYWAMKLGHPSKVELVKSSELKKESAPEWATLKYHFPARGDMPPFTITWYDGGKVNPPPRPPELEADRRLPESGSVFIGDKGKIVTSTYGESATRIIPESKHKATNKPDQVIPRVRDPQGKPNHYWDWINAIQQGKQACANFDYAGPFTEMVLLGNVALRAGKTIEWDGPNLKVTNDKDANQYITREYRKGWEL